MTREERLAALHEVHTRCGTLRIVEYDSAIEQNSVSAFQVIGCYILQQPKFNNPQSAILNQQYYPILLKVFEEQHGSIIQRAFCEDVRAGAIVTNQNKLYVCNITRTAATEAIHALLGKTEALHEKCLQFLGPNDLRYCSGLLFAVLTHLFALQDDMQRSGVLKIQP